MDNPDCWSVMPCAYSSSSLAANELYSLGELQRLYVTICRSEDRQIVDELRIISTSHFGSDVKGEPAPLGEILISLIGDKLGSDGLSQHVGACRYSLSKSIAYGAQL